MHHRGLGRLLGPLARRTGEGGLDKLCARGFRLLDGPGPVHVVVGETGVFAVDSAPPGRPRDEVMREARDAAMKVHAVIRSHPDGVGITAIPVVCTASARRGFTRGVAMCSPRDLVDTITSRCRMLDAETVDQLARAVALRLDYTEREQPLRRTA